MTIHEYDLYGIFLPDFLLWALVALLLNALLRALLSACGFYRIVWHQALFDLAIFVVVLGGLVFLNFGTV